MTNNELIKFYIDQRKVIVYNKPSKSNGIANLIFGDVISVDKEKENDEWLEINFKRDNKLYSKKFIYNKPKVITSKPKLEIYFIDVGQGDSILIQTPSMKKILIDGGPNNNSYEFIKKKYDSIIKKKEGLEFDSIIMTHADLDHAKGLIDILNDERIKIKAFYHNGIARFDKKKIKKKFKLKDEKNTEIGIKKKSWIFEENNGILKQKALLRKVKENGIEKEKEIWRLLQIYEDFTNIEEHDLQDYFDKLVKSLKKMKKRQETTNNNDKVMVKRLDNTSKLEIDDDVEFKVLGPINYGLPHKFLFHLII